MKISYHHEDQKIYMGIGVFLMVMAIATILLDTRMAELTHTNICHGLSKGASIQAELMSVKLNRELRSLENIANHISVTKETWRDSIEDGDLQYMRDTFVREGILDARGRAVYGADFILKDHPAIQEALHGKAAMSYNRLGGVLFTAPVFNGNDVEYVIYRRIDRGGVDGYFHLRNSAVIGEAAVIAKGGGLMFNGNSNGYIKQNWLEWDLMSVYRDLLEDLQNQRSSARRFTLNGVPMYASASMVRGKNFVLLGVISEEDANVGVSDTGELLFAVYAILSAFFLVGIYLVLVEEEDKHNLEKERTESVWRMSVQTVKALAKAIDAKDSYTNGHSTRVSEYAVMLGKRMGFNEEALAHLQYVALLHDVGKIGVPDSILNKKGKLTDEEYETIKTHTTIGADILVNIDEIAEVSIGARYHHERYDGKGYPAGLQGEDIPLIARIINVADSYDAMTSERGYRSALPQSAVRSEIVRCSGTQFDPKIAKIMLDIIDEDKDYQLRDHSYFASNI